jgi:hypothetical protein
MVCYDIVILRGETIQIVAHNKFDGFDHLTFIFWPKFSSLF